MNAFVLIVDSDGPRVEVNGVSAIRGLLPLQTELALIEHWERIEITRLRYVDEDKQ